MKTIQYNERRAAKKFLDYFSMGLPGGLSLDSSEFNGTFFEKRIINLTRQRFGLTRVPYS